MSHNPFRPFVDALVAARDGATTVRMPVPPVALRTATAASQPDGPTVLLFAPHPDDECIQGGLALRLGREDGCSVVDVPVTLGSKVERKAGRRAELEAALTHLGWSVRDLIDRGLERVNEAGRRDAPEAWAEGVGLVAEALQATEPAVIMLPHRQDWNSTHIGVHLLVMEALANLPPSFATTVVQTEYWGQLPNPNLMVELTPEHVADLVAATACHVGEVERNPYHLSLPAFLMDCVRRGGEIVGGQGGEAPNFMFAALYRVDDWRDGRLQPRFEGGRVITGEQTAGPLLY